MKTRSPSSNQWVNLGKLPRRRHTHSTKPLIHLTSLTADTATASARTNLETEQTVFYTSLLEYVSLEDEVILDAQRYMVRTIEKTDVYQKVTMAKRIDNRPVLIGVTYARPYENLF